MKKFEGILLISDVDGTLMGGGKLPSRENAEAIEYFTENGGMFSIASGRNECEICKIIQGKVTGSPLVPVNSQASTGISLNVNMPIISCNGAVIYSHTDDKILWQNPVGISASEVVEDVMAQFPGVQCYIYAPNSVYMLENSLYADKQNASFESLGEPPLPLRDISDEWFKVLFRYDAVAEIEAFIKTRPYKNDFQFCQSAGDLYEALNLTATKGHALNQLKKMFPQIKTVVAAGDNENDLTLIQNADIGCAVENALDILKKHADKTVASYNNHAIAYIINNIISAI